MTENFNEKIHCIDDHIPTDEELERSLAEVPDELRAKWRKEFEEWKKKRKSEN